jgi:hypothetical protein
MTLQTNQMVPVLMYHHVSPEPGGVTVSPVVFEEQMAFLLHSTMVIWITAFMRFPFWSGWVCAR